MDIYLPPPDATPAPVALFCHGGVWAHGERWHYAPMAARLAQAGILTLVMSYSLYPKASAAMQTAEVNDAFNWSLLNAGKYGGNPAEVESTASPPTCRVGTLYARFCISGVLLLAAGFFSRAFGRSPPVRNGAVAPSSSIQQEARSGRQPNAGAG